MQALPLCETDTPREELWVVLKGKETHRSSNYYIGSSPCWELCLHVCPCASSFLQILLSEELLTVQNPLTYRDVSPMC